MFSVFAIGFHFCLITALVTLGFTAKIVELSPSEGVKCHTNKGGSIVGPNEPSHDKTSKTVFAPSED